MAALVSIAIATYNGEKFLADLLDSLYAQTYKNVEVIACDDASSDQTVQILQHYHLKYGLNYWVNKKNLGFVKNFEQSIGLCSGEYIALADQDDIWFPEKIEQLLQHIGQKSLIHSDAVLTDINNHKIADSFTRFAKKQVQINLTNKLLFYNAVTGCTVLFRRDLLNIALPFPDNIIFHDWWLALCASKLGGIGYLDKPLIYYRQNSNLSGGAEIMNFKTLVSGSFRKGFWTDRSDKNRKMLGWFRAVKQSGLFSEYRKLIDEMINFHQSFFSKRIRPGALFLFLKYFRSFYPHYRLTTKILILCTSLIGINKR